jgi:phosphoglycolate phosphatase-like HAD superfamily hydrolase
MNQIVKGHIIFDHDGTLVRVNSSSMTLFPGFSDLLFELKSAGFNLYVWTARPRKSTLQSLKENGVVELFTAFSCADDGIMKPHPMGPLKMLDGIDKKKIIHIGDSEGDFVGANNFGIDFIFAGWNQSEYASYYQEKTPYIALDLAELKKIINLKFQ